MQNKQIKVSVIIPVYNVEEYIEACLESIWSQNFEDMEIICVEDFSTDESLKRLELYAKRDARIRIIKHKQNRGLSAARNTGLKHSKGKYILFVDSDDILASNAINILYNEAEEKQVDVVYFDYVKFYDSISIYGRTMKTEWISYKGTYTGKDFFCACMKNNEFKCQVWRQFIQRDFLEKHNINFLDGILHEDNLFSFYVAMEASKVSNLSEELYYYRQRENSIMRTKDEKRAQSLFVIMAEIFTYWKTHNFTGEVSFYIGQLWGEFYKTYKFYQAYGDIKKELQYGDDVERTIYRIINKDTDEKWLNTEELSIDKIRNFEYVIVYGAGKASKQIVEYLKLNNVQIDCIMVESIGDNPRKFCGYNVYEIRSCLSKQKNSVVIIGVSSKNSEGIEKQLINYGFENIVSLSDSK